MIHQGPRFDRLVLLAHVDSVEQTIGPLLFCFGGRAEARDNGHMPIVSRGFVDQAQLSDEFDQAKKALNPREVRDAQFILETDSSGEPAIFFSILLTPYGSQKSRLAEVTGRVTNTLFDKIQPYNRWGLQPYFNFTSDPAHYANPEWM